MKLESFNDLFIILLSDAYFLEKQILISLPRLLYKVESRELKDAIQRHIKDTGIKLQEIEEILQEIDSSVCPLDWEGSVRSVFQSIEEFVQKSAPSPLLDAALIAAVQKIVHAEIAAYGTLKAFAEVMDLMEIRNYFQELVKETQKTDAAFTKLAEGRFFSPGINVTAASRTSF